MENFVTYEQAVKLKKLGFDWECNHYYDYKHYLVEYTQSNERNYSNWNDKNQKDFGHYSAPTLTQVQKWLREENKISVDVNITQTIHNSFWVANVRDLIDFALLSDVDGFDTYEQALSAGIDKALEFLEETDAENKFKAFERIIIRSKDKSDIWVHGLFDGYYGKEIKVLIGDKFYMLLVDNYEILPYEDNEHLVGTTNEPEEIKLEKEEWIIANDNIYALVIGNGVTGRFVEIRDNMFLKSAWEKYGVPYQYCIRLSDFNPNDMKETRKHILYVKNGKIFEGYKPV